jgi:hypothetical protein
MPRVAKWSWEASTRPEPTAAMVHPMRVSQLPGDQVIGKKVSCLFTLIDRHADDSSFFSNVMSMDDELGASSTSTGFNSLNSSGMPTPSSGTRPGSQTNSYTQSCSSALSGVDDKRLDELLGDGIHNQVHNNHNPPVSVLSLSTSRF